MSAEEHMQRAHDTLGGIPAQCGVITVSDSRTSETDTGGDLVVSLLQEAGHIVQTRALVPDEPEQIDAALQECIGEDIDLLITTGGTGIASRDGTIEVVQPRLARELPGFGELFRQLSFEQVGAAAMLSRATGGVVTRESNNDLLLFALPGSPKAIELALKSLILPQLAHMRALTRSST